MKKQTKVTLIALSTTLFTFLHADVILNHYETKHPYANNENVTKTLSIPGASSIDVTIKGEVENHYDFVTITGIDKKERKYTGQIDKTFTLSGSTATIHFTSDSSVTKNGFSVDAKRHIEAGATHFETAHPYANNFKGEKKELTIPGAEYLYVNIKGEVENHYDKILITEPSGKVGVYTGKLNEQFKVKGDAIDVQLVSDGSINKHGVTVDVTDKKKVTVESMHDTEAYISDPCVFEITLSEKPQEEVTLPYSFKNINAIDTDYDNQPKFDTQKDGAMVKLGNNNTIITKGTKSFKLYVISPVLPPRNNRPQEIQYELIVGGKTAKCTLINKF